MGTYNWGNYIGASPPGNSSIETFTDPSVNDDKYHCYEYLMEMYHPPRDIMNRKFPVERKK